MSPSSIGRGAVLEANHGRYVVEAEAGKGGVGTVFKGKEIGTGAAVAVKILHSDRFRLTDIQKERFHKEIAASLRVRSPYLVRGLDDGVYREEPFLVMEWVSGGTLQQHISTTDYGETEVVRFYAQLLKAFAALRAVPLVHRDIKPNNIFLERSGYGRPVLLKLGDLGIARAEDAEHLTIGGDQLGSLLYISERQRMNPSSAGSRDDFYSLALVMYEIGTRRRVHTNNPRLMYLQPPRVPLALCRLIDWAMEDRNDWFEIHDELGHLIDLDAEKLRTSYAGSRILPGLIVKSEIDDLGVALSPLLRVSEDLPPVSTLLRRVASLISAAFNEAAEQIVDAGLRVGVEDELDTDGFLWMGVDFVELYREAMERAGLLERFLERSSA